MKKFRLNQFVRNLTFEDWEIHLVVIGLGATKLKKTKVMSALGFFWGKGGQWWCDFVCVERLGPTTGLILVILISFPRMDFAH